LGSSSIRPASASAGRWPAASRSATAPPPGAGPDFEQVKFNGESTGVKFNIGAPDLEFGQCKVQAKLYAKKCFIKRF
jgi:hypothetical protein